MAVTFIIRYKTEQQKKKLEAIAKHCGRSANSHILYLVDREIAWEKSKKSIAPFIKQSKTVK